ncbi:MAG TPA: carboxypeptidase-like regulatory domain-containing protein [Vicinamibacterales bacterium]|jgi:uncharacterized surface anchored protein|nr:carboxypeptidase-like regulatory domain-containing protein [Vicinamibacterales bacterium]
MSFTLTGKVTNAATNAGIPNANVRIVSGSGGNLGKNANTDTAGNYSIAGLAAGTVIVEAYLTGYTPGDKLLTLTANATENFALTAATYTLSGKVTDAATGGPVQDVLVKIVSASGTNFGKSATTNAAGQYSISGLNPGTLIVEAALTYVPKSNLLTVTANATQNFALTK